MFTRPTKATTALRLLLLSLLLSVQSLAMAHEVAHHHVVDGELCTVCAINGGLDSAVDCSHQPVLTTQLIQAPSFSPAQAPQTRTWPAHHSRAPPASS